MADFSASSRCSVRGVPGTCASESGMPTSGGAVSIPSPVCEERTGRSLSVSGCGRKAQGASRGEYQQSRPRILSGVQPSGKLHLGNYFGAIKQHIELQDAGRLLLLHRRLPRPDHAQARPRRTRPTPPPRTRQSRPRPARQILAENVRDVALDYLALGLDPAKADVLPPVRRARGDRTGLDPLHRHRHGPARARHSYKDKVDKGIDASVGLFTYPVLMAADILIVRSHLVPVGKDQVQHLEMTRDMAGYFNQRLRRGLPRCREAVLDEAAVVPGTDGQKMSKTYGNTIEIFAEGKALKKR